MRTLITTVAFIIASGLVACDTAADSPEVASAPATATDSATDPTDSIDPMLLATCHAAFRNAGERVAAEAQNVSTCAVDADCTITVSDTACTGELVHAVNAEVEEDFLGFVARVDARLCSSVPAECTPADDPSPKDLAVSCVQNRCTLSE